MLKAKQITKLRKKIGLMKTYKVRECWGLFGFDTLRNYSFREFKAKTPYHAMQRFFKWYLNSRKEKHRFFEANSQTTSNWGHIQIVDEKGFKTYYT